MLHPNPLPLAGEGWGEGDIAFISTIVVPNWEGFVAYPT
jgi:hypothetical protein